MQFTVKAPDELGKIAKKLLASFPENRVWLLHGDLGVGKTTFVKALIAALGDDPKEISSPTFAYVYSGEKWVHADLYRLEELSHDLMEQLEEDFYAGKHICIEWPYYFEPYAQKPHINLYFEHKEDGARSLRVEEEI